ncbi:MAG: hypothetical protein P8N67_03660 [Pseudomonadales bacterium]|jgi:hypothetical protein|nr:hypothetical protein [Pseudomonadales bacterium]
MHKITHFVLFLMIFTINQAVAQVSEAGVNKQITHTDNRGPGWVDIEMEAKPGAHPRIEKVLCRDLSSSLSCSTAEDSQEHIIAGALSGIALPPMLIHPNSPYRSAAPQTPEAANCVLKNLNKARSDTAAQIVLESCNVLHAK